MWVIGWWPSAHIYKVDCRVYATEFMELMRGDVKAFGLILPMGG